MRLTSISWERSGAMLQRLTKGIGMKRCLIVGAGGFGREVLSWASHVKQEQWKIAGFLDSNPLALCGKDIRHPILGDPDTWVAKEDEVFISGLGDPNVRLRVCGSLKSRGAEFVTLIHPSVITGLNIEIGEGCVIAPNVVITVNAMLERFVLVNIAASIGHDSRIGEGTTISCHCDVTGYVSIWPLLFSWQPRVCPAREKSGGPCDCRGGQHGYPQCGPANDRDGRASSTAHEQQCLTWGTLRPVPGQLLRGRLQSSSQRCVAVGQ